MAKFNGPRTEKLYAVAAAWVDAALVKGDSLFTPGKPIWTPGVMQDFHHRFVEGADESKDSFDEKLRRQLETAKPETIQLAAELLYVHLLPGNSTGGDHKRKLVNMVLGWMPKSITLSAELNEALNYGLFAEGISWRTHRPFLMGYLLEFVQKWWGLSASERKAALDDPWAFKEIAFSVPMYAARGQAEILLHLVYPESFEHIISHTDKSSIAKAFASMVTQPTDDVDRQLLQIRNTLAKTEGKGFSFYARAIKAKWKPDADPWNEFVRFAKLFYQSPTFEEDERTYKLRIAEKLRAVLKPPPAVGDVGLVKSLKRIFQDKDQNIVGWRDHDPFLSWYPAALPASHAAITQITDVHGSAANRVRAFLKHLPKEVVKSPGSRITLASLFLMATAPTDLPPFRATVFSWAFKRVDHEPPPDDADEGSRYEHALAFLDLMIQRCRAQGVQLRDRLDAQGVLWAMAKTKQRPEWMTPGDWDAFEKYVEDRPDIDVEPPASGERRYWKIAPGERAGQWDECLSAGLIRIGWDQLGDLTGFDLEAFEKRQAEMLKKYPDWGERGSGQVWTFVNDIKKGDLVIANKGMSQIVGVGEITGDYFYDDTLNVLKHCRKVKWYDTTLREIGKQPWRNTLVELNKDEFERLVGKIEKLDEDATPQPDLPVGEQPDHRLVTLLLSRMNVVLHGPPGTGKTYTSLHVAELWKQWQGQDSVSQITFHPSYAYEDFVEGFRPNREGQFKLQSGIFVDVCEAARTSPKRRFLLVIDELNRGDVARIFGELITLIERDKRNSGASRKLPYSRRDFFVPSNLYLLGTMNTADRSISLLDVAIRRRFCFVEFPPDTAVITGSVQHHRNIEGIDLAQLMLALNARLQQIGVERDRAIGHSHFLIEQNGMNSLGELRDRFRHDIIPLVEEYCYSNRSQMQSVLGQLIANGLLNADVLNDDERFVTALRKLCEPEA